MKISNKTFKGLVNIWQTTAEQFFNIAFFYKKKEGVLEIATATKYVLYKTIIVPPYGTFDDEENVLNKIPITSLHPLAKGTKLIDMEIQPDGLLLDGQLIKSVSPVFDFESGMRRLWEEYLWEEYLWEEYVATAERRATAQPIDDMLNEYAKVYKSIPPYRKRQLKNGSERLTIGFDLYTGEQRAYYEMPDDNEDGDFIVRKQWQLNTTNLDVSHMQEFKPPMRYFDHAFLKPALESMIGEFVELHFHPNPRKGLVCVSEERIEGVYYQTTALIMPISYIKYN